MKVERCNYIVHTNTLKRDGKPLSERDLINVGYMAGRYGINLDGNLQGNYKPVETDRGLLININVCTKDMLEDNLRNSGIGFDVVV